MAYGFNNDKSTVVVPTVGSDYYLQDSVTIAAGATETLTFYPAGGSAAMAFITGIDLNTDNLAIMGFYHMPSPFDRCVVKVKNLASSSVTVYPNTTVVKTLQID